MNFYTSVEKRGIPITINNDGGNEDDEGDVNICVNGSVVAWFDSERKALVYHTEWLKEEGLTVIDCIKEESGVV